jgi:hypothetical protein
MWRGLADAVVIFHLAFIAFAILGGVLVLRDRRWAAWHLPVVAWAAFIEFTGTICPLTPLENALRRRAGDAGYSGGFVERYLLPIVYPADLTPAIQTALGAGVVMVNVFVYLLAWRRWRMRKSSA